MKYVDFETAKIAKNKGIDGVLFTGSKCWVRTLDNKILHNDEIQSWNPDHDRTEYYLFQPSQVELQRYLRECGGFHIYITPFRCTETNNIMYKLNMCKEYSLNPIVIYPITFYDTYEEALEIGLKRGLIELK